MLGRLFGGFKQTKYSFDEIADKTKHFLMPQMLAMKELEGNKYAFITIRSVFYIVDVAEEIGGRTIEDNERDKLILSVVGEDFRPRIEKLWEILTDGRNDINDIKRIRREIGKLANKDVKNGGRSCSNLMLEEAREHSEWEKKIQQSQ
jgi:hypothetical protein